MNFPIYRYIIYRYIGNDLRNTLMSNAPAEPVTPAVPTEPERSAEPVGPSVPSGSVCTVRKGDCLSGIAKAQLCDAAKWKAIYEANREAIKNPNVIYVERVLVLPVQ